MAELKLNQGAWVVVCDGRKAIFFENIGDRDYPDLRVQDAEEHEAPQTHELGAGPPGRVHQRHGEARSAVEQTDWHDREEEAFLKDLADRLDRAVHGKKVSELAIVAPPRALGMIRKAYSNGLKGAIVAEIDKDLTGVPTDQIETQLVGKPGR